MFTTRFWGSTAALLCALLLQSCQLHSVSATEEEEPAVGSSSVSIMRQRTSSEPQAMRSLTLYSAPPAAHVPPSRFSTISAHKEDLSAALSTRSTMEKSLVEPCDLPAAEMPRASRVVAVPLDNKPGVSSLVFMTSSGEHVRFIQIDGQWRAAMQVGYGVVTLQHTLPVVGSADVNNFLFWLQSQDQWTSREHIHILKMSQAPYGPCVYLGRVGLLGGVPTFSAQGVDQGSCTASRGAFGAKEWKHYFGEVEEALALPDDIEAALDAPCPFWERSTVRDTHLLVLIPTKVDGVPFTLNLLGELIERPRNGGYKAQYRYYDSRVQAQIGAASPQASYWLLMTRDVLPESRSKGYGNQKRIIAGHARRTCLPYEVPKVLEAATAILTHYVRDGAQLYRENPLTFTRCQELVSYESGNYATVVGGFGFSGLHVQNPYTYASSESRGVAGCRKFCVKKVSRTIPANKQVPFTSPSFRSPSSSTPSILTTMDNSSSAPCDLSAAAMPTASRVEPSGDESGHALSPDALWWSSIGGLDELEEISIAETFVGEEASEQPAKQRSSDPEDDLTNRKVRYSEGSESDQAAELPAFWDLAAQHDQAFDDVASASPDTSYSSQIAAQKAAQDKKQAQLQSKIDARSRRYKKKKRQLSSFFTPAEPFGASAWQQYYGEVGSAPDLPSDIDDILDRACPFWSGRKIRDTHLLVLIPATVDGVPFTLNLLKELVENPKSGGHRGQYNYYDRLVQAQLGAASPAASYWLLMTRDVLPKSRSKTYADQKKLVADHARRTGMPYELPKALEAATAILTHHVGNGERLYSDSPWTVASCQESISYRSGEYPAVVGGFASSGLDVYDVGISPDNDSRGVAGCWKFF
jgi:hypothetical protein